MTTINLPYPADQAGDIRDKEATKVEKQPEKTLIAFKDITRDPLFWERAVPS